MDNLAMAKVVKKSISQFPKRNQKIDGKKDKNFQSEMDEKVRKEKTREKASTEKRQTTDRRTIFFCRCGLDLETSIPLRQSDFGKQKCVSQSEWRKRGEVLEGSRDFPRDNGGGG